MQLKAQGTNLHLKPSYGNYDGLPYSWMKCGWQPYGVDDMGNAYKLAPNQHEQFPFKREYKYPPQAGRVKWLPIVNNWVEA